jgi:hypothetical protein
MQKAMGAGVWGLEFPFPHSSTWTEDIQIKIRLIIIIGLLSSLALAVAVVSAVVASSGPCHGMAQNQNEWRSAFLVVISRIVTTRNVM